MEGVATPTDSDCLLGRGHRCANHPGTIRFREIVKENAHDLQIRGHYNFDSDHLVKVKKILMEWKTQVPPGRFLKLDPASNLWYEVRDEEVKSKIVFALKEKIGKKEATNGTLSGAHLPLRANGNGARRRGKMLSWPLKDIETPGNNDCIIQRGSMISHSGNIRCRKLVEANFSKFYATESSHERNWIVAQIIRVWRSQSPPGRFLKQDENHLWHDVGDEFATRMIYMTITKGQKIKEERRGGDSPPGEAFPTAGVKQRGPNGMSVVLPHAPIPPSIATGGHYAAGESRASACSAHGVDSPLGPGTSLGFDLADASKKDSRGGHHPSDVQDGLGENDCIVQKRGGKVCHSGNKKFLLMAEKVRGQFEGESSLRARDTIVRRLVRAWRGLNPPGRFLRLDDSSNRWCDVGDDFARKKIHSTFSLMISKGPKRQGEKRPQSDHDSLQDDPSDLRGGSPAKTRGNQHEDPNDAIARSSNHQPMAPVRKNSVPSPDTKANTAQSTAGASGPSASKTAHKGSTTSTGDVTATSLENNETIVPAGKGQNSSSSSKNDANYQKKISRPLKDIKSPGGNDFIIQKEMDSHNENKRFRAVYVDKTRAQYEAAESPHDKNSIVSQVVKKWRSLHPPGRFLKKNTNLWIDVGDKVAMEIIHKELSCGKKSHESATTLSENGNAAKPPGMQEESVVSPDESPHQPASTKDAQTSVVSEATQSTTAAADEPDRPTTPFRDTNYSTQVLINTGVVLHDAVDELIQNLAVLAMRYPPIRHEIAMHEIDQTILPGLQFISRSMMSIGQQQQAQELRDGSGLPPQVPAPAPPSRENSDNGDQADSKE